MPPERRLVQVQSHAAAAGGPGPHSSSINGTSGSAQLSAWTSLYQRAAEQRPADSSPIILAGGGTLAEPTGLAVLASGALAVTDCTTQTLYLIDPLTDSVLATTAGCGFDRPYSVIAVPAECTATVCVEEHDPQWAQRFALIQRNALEALEGVTTRVEHVGSTSVPGLAAKPIIDIDAIIVDEGQVQAAVEALAPLGYAHRGENGIPGRHSFNYSGPPDGGGKRNFYVCFDGNDSLLNHLMLRDHLRAHPEATAEYSTLKIESARLFPRNIDAYVEAKTGLIVKFLAAAGFEQAGLDAIIEANKQNGPLAEPEEEIEGAERLVVTDRSQHRLVEVDPAGGCQFVSAVGEEGAGIGECNGPRSVALLRLGAEGMRPVRELQYKCQLSFEFSIENAKITWNCP